MNLDLTDAQAALVSDIQTIVGRHSEIPAAHREKSHYYDFALDKALSDNGFLETRRGTGPSGLEAALIVEEVCRSPVAVEIGASLLVAPHVASFDIPRPIVLASGDFAKPQRFLPMAKSMLFERAGELLLLPVSSDQVEPVASIYGYPMGRLSDASNLSKAQLLGAAAAQLFRQWWRVSIAAESAGLMRSAVAFTLDYVKQRRLFGVTVGHFQVVQHRLAQAHRIAEAVHILTMKAAWSGELFDADQAATFAQEHIPQVAFDLHQFNGAISVGFENPLHFWTYRLKALQSELGGADAAALDTADQLWGAAEAWAIAG
jgi:hypothetical protein